MSESYDVTVIGGGPAGAALATFLARRGWRCLIAEKSCFPRYHIGESLIPHTYGIFERLGVLDKLNASEFPVKHSVRFVPPDGSESAAFYFSESIPGDGARTWQVERGAFDAMMLEHASAEGVEVRSETSVHHVLFGDGNRATGILTHDESKNSDEEISARVVVDASGRGTVIGQQLGLVSTVPRLEKASLWAYFRGGYRLPGIDAGETTIFTLSGGSWFWYIPLPDDIVSVGIVGPPERLFFEGLQPEEVLSQEIAQCVPLAERLWKAEQDGPVRGLKELAYLNRQTCGDGWVMIGDARAFLDPIYSSGLFLALQSAEMAAVCVDEALKANDVSAARIGAFEHELTEGVDTIRRLIHAFYDPDFSFSKFAKTFPEQRGALIDCLVGDVLKDMTAFRSCLSQMTPAPPPLV